MRDEYAGAVSDRTSLEAIGGRLECMVEGSAITASMIDGFLTRSGAHPGMAIDRDKGGPCPPSPSGHLPAIFDRLDDLERRLESMRHLAEALGKIG